MNRRRTGRGLRLIFTAHQLGMAAGLVLVVLARAAGRPMALHPRRCAEYG